MDFNRQLLWSNLRRKWDTICKRTWCFLFLRRLFLDSVLHEVLEESEFTTVWNMLGLWWLNVFVPKHVQNESEYKNSNVILMAEYFSWKPKLCLSIVSISHSFYCQLSLLLISPLCHQSNFSEKCVNNSGSEFVNYFWICPRAQKNASWNYLDRWTQMITDENSSSISKILVSSTIRQ